ncbi:hypothetical protein GCM10007898_13200 [Dyella flagellata]|uniref:Amine oxidase domain-containing protein n=1 Tax=Dyella flagellata TaxID=1867833 RepID=A0ABQ5XA31_9GAMM|nr:hypothetical protein GCM10007898_13200 [Dyella flagellata]
MLEQAGYRDYVLLEARDALGGRILSCPVTPMSSDVDRFDLGATWFWPEFQPQLDRLIRELGLTSFAQYESGDMLIDRPPAAHPMRARGYGHRPVAMRLAGGMGALVDALYGRLDPARIMVGQRVRQLHSSKRYIELKSENASGLVSTWHVEHVLLAVPPRLVEDSIAFSPGLPRRLSQSWRATTTWMAPHAKYFAIYQLPFWREQGLSGEARSTQGPLGEIHDVSMPDGSAALFGFFSVPAEVRQGIPDDALKTRCRVQLSQLFGPQAATPVAEFVKDWALDPYTATSADLQGVGEHVATPPVSALSGPWSGRVAGIASEWSPQFPGYVAGAIDAATLGVKAWLASEQPWMKEERS